MRLKTIKLAGFKSFVDATTLHLPSNLIGVVGPNGCGKSNIIDAVRWVMGESSARLLRGESMADVIFNGSNARKPVGTATVELIFDNGDGKAGGEFARFAEIAIKRQVSRDGQSGYFLNGTRCRRRDITDLFLGTGLGPRSYSIIEQGMISRIVEARPEDIRAYLEEAAGISKYKERRRETENRIRHTRENLERLDDLRGEVAKHIEHLQRQARQAERYKQLKAEHRQKERELWALQWRALDGELGERRSEIARRETALEAAVAELRSIEAAIEAGRERHAAATEEAGRVQGELYEVGAEIARLEQAIAHRRELRDQQRREQEQAEAQFQELASHVDLDATHLAQLDGELAELVPALEATREREGGAGALAASTEEAVQGWQEAWDGFARRRNAVAQEAEVDRARIEALDRSLDERAGRIGALERERQGLDTTELEAAIARLADEQTALATRQAAVESALAERRERSAAQAEANRTQAAELAALRERHQAVTGRLSSLEALQQAALGEDSAALGAWLARHGLADARRLAQVITVDGGSEAVVEAALGDFLEAVIVPDPWALVADDGWPEGDVTLLADRPRAAGERQGLAAVVDGPAVLDELLGPVRGVEALAAARDAALRPGERIAAADGAVGGRDWLRVRGERPTAGVLARQKELAGLRAERDAIGEEGRARRERLAAGEATLRNLEEERDALQQELNGLVRRAAELDAQRTSRSARIEAVRVRDERIGEELEGLVAQVDRDQEAVREARRRLEAAIEGLAELEGEREGLERRRRELFEARDQARREARELRDEAQRLALAVEAKRSAKASTAHALERTRGQLAHLEARRAALAAQLAETIAPLPTAEAELEGRLEARLAVEQRVTEARAQADAVADEVRALERSRHAVGERIEALRRDVEAQRLAQEGLRVQAEALARRLADQDLAPQDVLTPLAEDATAAAWEEALASLERRIQRLEPVNLAAIEEFEQETERKAYLDAQNDDLVAALDTLERAIRKIDRETRTRFKETFDRVNAGVQALFPRLFGGGHGFLELVGEDLLEAGVAIMARPPGKRIANIHLLSGGEKALTAVSFVFAIFQLNPAPFCMLDEVDAPLDDANVGRFSDMVRDMAEQVQFVIVTHNKSTMAIAHQLMGVTMREAGVSRMVSVDVAEAERLAASGS